MKCKTLLFHKSFCPNTQNIFTPTSSKTYRHWYHTMMPTLSIIPKVTIPKIAYIPVELFLVVVILILSKNCVVYPCDYGNMIRIHFNAHYVLSILRRSLSWNKVVGNKVSWMHSTVVNSACYWLWLILTLLGADDIVLVLIRV